ncbi:MAG: exosortase A, partial [Acetobacteraceae bacterium]
MSTQQDTLARPSLSDTWHVIRGSAVSLTLGLLLLGVLFWREVASAVRIWEESTAYNHCFLIIPIVLYLLWDRQEQLRGISARPAPWVAVAGIPIAVGWLLAERLGIMEGRQLMVVSFAQILFLAVLGWRLWYAMLGPLLYLYFLVPFGEFLVPRLQDITAIFIRHGLSILAIPAYIDGYTIEIAEGTFYVAEACAGLRFLIASIAFGVLYALMMYRSPVRRTVFIAISIIVPIIANGFRALGIVVMGHMLGSAEAAAADHVLYGWIFFSLVILMLIAIGLPFREDGAPPVVRSARAVPVPAGLASSMVAVVAVLVTAVISPAVSAGIDRLSEAPELPATPLVTTSGCAAGPMPSSGPASASVSMQRVTCADAAFDVLLQSFSPRSTPGPVFAERRRLTRPAGADDVSELPLMDQEQPSPAWRLVVSSHPPSVAAASLWIGGDPVQAGLRTRVRMAKASLLGGADAPLLVVIRPAGGWAGMTPADRR